MAAAKNILSEFPWDPRYQIAAIDEILTPALVLYPEFAASNIDRTVELLDGHPDRWRPHIKTAKLGYTMRLFIERGIRNFKCATTLELLLACQSGARDVLLAHPAMGANARRVREIAQQFPKVQISVLAENEEQLPQWRGSNIGIFLDINPGMNRTGIEQNRAGDIVKLVDAIAAAGLEFRGLHYYDGQYGSAEPSERSTASGEGYRQFLKIVAAIENHKARVPEIITAGTPTFANALSFQGFRSANFIHRISPGTVVYCDATSLAQLPKEYGYQPAVLVLTRVVSRPRAGMITCDAGHKTVSADSGIPTCVVVGHRELSPLSPSEEHLPMAVAEGSACPETGDALYLLPRHVCPSVNNFDEALLVHNGKIEAVEKVSARGRENPLLQSARKASSI